MRPARSVPPESGGVLRGHVSHVEMGRWRSGPVEGRWRSQLATGRISRQEPLAATGLGLEAFQFPASMAAVVETSLVSPTWFVLLRRTLTRMPSASGASATSAHRSVPPTGPGSTSQHRDAVARWNWLRPPHRGRTGRGPTRRPLQSGPLPAASILSPPAWAGRPAYARRDPAPAGSNALPDELRRQESSCPCW